MLLLRTLPLLLVPAALGGEIHVVDVSAGQGASTIQTAIDAAASGDTILVHAPASPSNYALQGITIRGKGLTVVGRTSSSTVTSVRLESIEVVDLPAGETVVLRRLWPLGVPDPMQGDPSRAALSVVDCEGSVRASECSFGQFAYSFFTPPGVTVEPSVALDRGLDVTLTDCSVQGSTAGGLVLSRSRAAVYRSTITGGPGQPAQSYMTAESGDGFVALELRDRSFAWIGDSEVVGGEGGWTECIHNSPCTALPGDGGPGAIVEAGSLCVSLESDFQGGAPGELWWSAGPGSQSGVQGPPLVGQVIHVPGMHRGLHMPAAARSGEAVPLELVGQPGEEVWLLAARSGGHRYLGPLVGVLLVNAGFVAPPTLVGVVPPSGRLLVDHTLPAVAAGEAETFSMQASFRTSPSRFRLSPVGEIVVAGSGAPLLTPPARLHVDANAPPGGDGLSWSTASSSLADALLGLPFESGHVTEVWLAQGAYLCAPSNAPGSRERIVLGGAIELLGGFSGTETEPGQRDPDLYPTVISGDLLGDDRLPGGGTGENSRGMIFLNHSFLPEASRVSGVRFTGANGMSALVISGAAVVEDCTFDCNDGDQGAGGLSIFEANPTLNTGVVRNSDFRSNAGATGALYIGLSSGYSGTQFPTPYRFSVSGCSFVGNTARGSTWHPDGGRAAYGGAITALGRDDTIQITNCTLVDNDNPLHHPTYRLPYDGLHTDRRLDVTFTNNVSWSAYQLTGQHNYFTLIEPQSGDVATYNRVAVIHPLWDPLTNTTAVPGFVDVLGPDGLAGTGDENVRLAPGSPCIDAGHSGLVPAELTSDLDGRPRFVDDPTAPNVGAGGTRIVDMGAYEH